MHNIESDNVNTLNRFITDKLVYYIYRNYIYAIERFLDSQDDVHVMLTHIRAIYLAKLKEPSFVLSSLSIGGTLADTITEVRTCMYCFIASARYVCLIKIYTAFCDWTFLRYTNTQVTDSGQCDL